MRLYTFCNFYLSSLQQGLQTTHILGELNNKLHSGDFKGQKGHYLLEWQDKHKTVIICNGGNSASIRDIIELFDNEQNPYPWAYFNEDGDSLDGALTGVGIILPEEIYEIMFEPETDSERSTYIHFHKDGTAYEYPENTYMYDFIKRIESAPLAR